MHFNGESSGETGDRDVEKFVNPLYGRYPLQLGYSFLLPPSPGQFGQKCFLFYSIFRPHHPSVLGLPEIVEDSHGSVCERERERRKEDITRLNIRTANAYCGTETLARIVLRKSSTYTDSNFSFIFIHRHIFKSRLYEKDRASEKHACSIVYLQFVIFMAPYRSGILDTNTFPHPSFPAFIFMHFYSSDTKPFDFLLNII